MTPGIRPVGLRPAGRRYFLGSERELRLGVYFCFRLFNVAPETTARFSHINDLSRNRSPPGPFPVATMTTEPLYSPRSSGVSAALGDDEPQGSLVTRHTAMESVKVIPSTRGQIGAKGCDDSIFHAWIEEAPGRLRSADVRIQKCFWA